MKYVNLQLSKSKWYDACCRTYENCDILAHDFQPDKADCGKEACRKAEKIIPPLGIRLLFLA